VSGCGIFVVVGYEHTVFDPGFDDLAGLGFGLIGSVLQDDFPCGAVGDVAGVGVSVAVWQAGVDGGEDLVERVVTQSGPCIWRCPWLDGLHLVSVWIKVGCVTEGNANKPEPFGRTHGRGNIDLAAVHANGPPAFFLLETEGLRFLRAHRGQCIDEAAAVLHRGGAPTAAGVAGVCGSLGGVVWCVNRDIVLVGEVGEHLDDVVDGAIRVFLDRVRLDEGIDADEVDFALDDDGFDSAGQCAALGSAGPVEGHQLAGSGPWRGQE
jgi:hypothetical protein